MMIKITDKARKTAKRLNPLYLLTLLPLFSACYEYDDEDRAEALRTVPLTFYLQSAGSQQTRAYEGEVDGETAENAIKTIKVWFYKESNFVAYSDEIDNGKVTINVPNSAFSNGTVDAYIIANAESAGISLGRTSQLTQITGAIIATDKFGTATPVTAVPTEGLPMSRIIKDLSLLDNNNEVKTDLGTYDITRAVSKICFAFGMYKRDFGEIIGISLDGGQIATSEYIMPVEPSTANTADYTNPYLGDLRSNIVAGSYEATELLFGTKNGTTALFASDAIYPTTTSDNPSNYTWTNWSAAYTGNANEKAQQYYSAVFPFVKQTVYLRESDKKLKGKIYYRYRIPTIVNGTTTYTTTDIKGATFEMDATSTVQDFARNHVWIVYSYFEGGKLYVNPTVAPWTNAPELSYTLKMSTNMRLFDSWLYRYDTDGDYTYFTNWATSYMAVSEGRAEATATETVAGRPTRSPQIQLMTTGVNDATVPGSGTFELTIDNNDFEIIRVNKTATGAVDSYETSVDGVLTIPAGDDVYTYFYIVPKAGVTPSDPKAKVSLYYNDPVLGKVKVTFNSNSLPGYSDDSSEIWAYYVAPGDYRYIVDVIDGVEKPRYLKMYFKDYNNPLVPTPVQN